MVSRGVSGWGRLLLAGAGGYALASLTDPARGKRRRALVRDRATHLANRSGRFTYVAGLDLAHRLKGVFARARALLRGRRQTAPAKVLTARIRSQLGRAVSHPHAIAVRVLDGGIVELTGDVLTAEHRPLLRAVRSAVGPLAIHDGVRLHDGPDDVPALQGTPAWARPRVAREAWAPATRLLAMLGAGASVAAASRTCGIRRTVLAGTGGALGLRALTDRSFRYLLGFGGGRRGIDVRKHLHVQAPPDAVYRVWRNLRSLPRFMPHVKEVREIGDGRSHWTIAGPANVPLSFTAEITKDEPGKLLAWKSADGSMLRHAGIVRFRPAQDGTDVDVQMSYNPPGGWIAHALASALAADPRHDLDRDLVLMKSLLEDGKTSMRGETIRREDVEPPTA